MIEEQFVSFETARMLKEAGFDVPCFNQYTGRGTIWHCDCPENFNKSQCATSCLTQALVVRWLREAHNLHVWCEVSQYGDWFYCIDKIKPYKQYVAVSEADFSSYEEALEAGLQEAVKLIKK